MFNVVVDASSPVDIKELLAAQRRGRAVGERWMKGGMLKMKELCILEVMAELGEHHPLVQKIEALKLDVK